MALRLELARKEVKDDPNRTAELAAYFTHAKLQVSGNGPFWQMSMSVMVNAHRGEKSQYPMAPVHGRDLTSGISQ